MKSGNILLGVFAGIAAGALMGILFAPEKGAKTRKQILRKGEDYADVLKEKFDDFLDIVTEKYESTRQKAEGSISKGKTKYEKVKKEVKNATA